MSYINKTIYKPHLFQITKEAKDSWAISKGEKSLAPESKDFTTCISANPICNQEIDCS